MMLRLGRKGLIIALISILLLLSSVNSFEESELKVVVVEIKGTINEGAYTLMLRAVNLVSQLKAEELIIILDTYGGYLYSMDKIIEELSKLSIPKVTWIPPGGKAVSAGAIIALSSDLIYVGEGAVVGACRPYPEDEKVIAYVKARIRSLAERKSLNATVIGLLEEMVEKNRSFTAREAVELGLAEGYVNDLKALLSARGLSNAVVYTVKEDLFVELAAVLFDPGLALAMLVVGVLLILLEVKATGFQGWGILGGILIAISLYVMGIIGWNIMTLILVSLGLVSLFIELKKPGLQVFGAAGIALLLFAILLEYLRQPYINLWNYAPPVMVFTGAVSILLLFIIYKAGEAIKLKKPDYREKLLGKEGYAKTVIKPGERGVVYMEGEEWTAVSDRLIEKGDKVRVINVEGLTLIVEKINNHQT
ncbi:MAG: hypothetical protein DRJ47_02200 [Thermoprotei archaeon]|nr:MAG: hypothetical protein DRJ47_02200 [Thermoprotei archaeon]